MAIIVANHPNVLTTKINEVETLGYKSFRAKVEEQIASGNRLLSFFGSPIQGPAKQGVTTPKNVALNAVFLATGRGLIHFRGIAEAAEEYKPLTNKFSFMHCFEREIHDQYGLPMTGHPWLKPIRFEGQQLGKMNDYRFYKLEGKEVHEVAVGPVHAGVIEPGHFRFMCHGEKVYHLEIHLGYQHRGAEALLTKTEPRKISPLIESIAGDTAVAYTVAFCRGWEALCGISVSPEVECIRGIALELERVAMHLVGLGGLATDVAFLPGSSTYGRLRTSVINLSMRLCGSRFGRSWFRPGQLRFAFTEKHKADIRKTIDQVQKDIALINRLFRQSTTVRHRLCTTGTVPTELAKSIGIVGMTGRASGVACDTRGELKGGVYAAHPIEVVTEPDGDCWSRGLIRIREIDLSLDWILKIVNSLSEVSENERVEYSPLPNACVVSVEEGWRGEVVQYIETDSSGKIAHFKVQDPSIRNWFGLAQAVKDNAIYDFPICNKSFDLSYCGNDL